MSADLLAQEGVVDPLNPSDDLSDDEAPDERGHVIQSTIAQMDGAGHTTKSEDSDDDDEDFEDSEDGDEETIDDEHKERVLNAQIEDDVNNDAENENEEEHQLHRDRSERRDGFCNRMGVYVAVLLVVVAIYFRDSPSEDLSLPICSRMPDSTAKSELDLSCPVNCDEYDHSGNCLIYVPFSANEYSINARGIDSSLNQHPCLSTKWDIEDSNVFSQVTDDTLRMVFNSPGREHIVLTLSIVITDHISGSIKYYKEKECTIILVIYKAPYFAIDLGTTYSCIAFQTPTENPKTRLRDTEIVMMDQSKMEYCIPSSIYFAKDGSVYIGNKAQKMSATNNDRKNLLYDLKRIIGRPSTDPAISEFVANHQFTIDLTKRFPKIWIPNRSQYVTPEQALAAILVNLVKSASRQFGVPNLSDVVISIPAIFHDSQRKAVHTAAAIGQLTPRRLVVEPSAASMAYIYHSPSSETKEFSKYFMTLDVGGGTTDVSVLRCTGLYCEVLGVAGNASLGGIDFDEVIVGIMVDEVLRLNPKWTEKKLQEMPLFGELVSRAETVKKALSVDHQYLVRVPNIRDSDYIQITVSRHQFEQHPRTKRLVESIVNLAQKAMYDDNPLSSSKGRQHPSNIRAILMIGGSVKMPIIQNALRQEFVKDNGGRTTQIIFPDTDPQLMVVKGGAIIGGSMAYTDAGNADILMNQIPEISIDDVLPMALGFDVCVVDNSKADGHRCGVMDILIEKNSKYPVKGSGIYCQKAPMSTSASLMLYEGDSMSVDDNFFLTKLQIYDVPPRSDHECDSISVELRIDDNGIANITAKTNNQIFTKELPVQSNDGHLTPDEIKKLHAEVTSWFT